MTMDVSLFEYLYRTCSSWSPRGSSGYMERIMVRWPGDQPLSWELFASTSSAPTPGIYLTSSRLPALTTFQRLGGDLPPDSGKLTCRGPKAHLALGR